MTNHETANHTYNTPAKGTVDWHTPLNTNFDALDVDVEIRDLESNLGDHDPQDGAKFFATDTGQIYFGDGTNWNAAFELTESASGRYLDNTNGLNFTGPAEWENEGATNANSATGDDAVAAGGVGNTATNAKTAIGGGSLNEATGGWSTIAGGFENLTTAQDATIAGGSYNEARGQVSTIGGGNYNEANGMYTTIAGGGPADTSNESTTSNVVYDDYGTIAGGGNNQAGIDDGDSSITPYATVSGGEGNTANGDHSTVGGGKSNTAGASYATVAGGSNNEAIGLYSAVLGGFDNTASGQNAVALGDRSEASGESSLAGGRQSMAQGENSLAFGAGAIASDTNSIALGSGATSSFSGTAVAIGPDASSTAYSAVALGSSANADASESFVWSDSSDPNFAATSGATGPTGANTFHALSTGGFRFATATDGSGDPTNGARLIDATSGWASFSTAAVKQDFESIDTQDILDGVQRLDIEQWSYESAPDVDHVGPIAEEFDDEFGLGDSEEHIDGGDADGIALAAIQGLAECVEEKEKRIGALEERLAAVEEQVEIESAQSAD